MEKGKSIFPLFIGLFTAAILIGFWSYFTDWSDPAARAAKSLEEGDIELAKDWLEDADLPDANRLLYESYISRAEGNLEQSNEQLMQALDQNPDQAAELEITLNQALNAYIEQRDDRLETALEKAKAIEPNDPWVQFFEGISYFVQGDYDQAQQLWSSPNPRIPHSKWMEVDFGNRFNPNWENVRGSVIAIERGDFIAARRRLNRKLTGSISDEEKNEINFLIGLTYLEEAETKNPGSSIPYFRLALSYFTKLPKNDPLLEREKHTLIPQLEERVHFILNEDDSLSYSDIQNISFLLTALSSLEADKELSNLGSQLLSHTNRFLNEQKYNELLLLIPLLTKTNVSQENKNQILNRIASRLRSAVENQQFSEARTLWKLVSQLQPNSPELKQEIIRTIAQTIQELIQNEDSTLVETRQAAMLWSQFSSEASEQQLANFLVQQALQLVKQGNTGEKPVRLLRLALEITPSQRQELLDQLSEQLTAIYQEKKKQGELGELVPMLALAKQYQLTPFLNVVEADTPNLLSNLNNQWRQRLDHQSISTAEWLIEANSNDPAILELAATIFYEAGQYKKALILLNQIEDKTPSQEEAAVVASLLLSKDQSSLLFSEELSNDSYVRLALGALEQANIEKSQEWMQKISEQSSSTALLKALIASEKGSWEDVLSSLSQLPSSIRKIQSVTNLETVAKIHQGNANFNSTSHTGENSLNELIFPLQTFMDFYWRPWNQESLQAFAEYVRTKNAKQALTYFRNAKPNDPIIQVFLGTLFYDTGDANNALSILQEAASESNEPLFIKKMAPILAKSYSATHQPVDAYVNLKKYFSLPNPSQDTIPFYAQILEQLRLYPESYRQFGVIEEQNGSLTPNETISKLETLFHLGRWEEGARLGKEILNPEYILPLSKKLEAARIYSIMEKPQQFRQVLKTLIEDSPPKSSSDLAALILTYISVPNYQKALEISEKYHNLLEETPEGNISLAILYQNLSKRILAQTYASKAFSMDPDHPILRKFAEEFEPDLLSIQKEVVQLQKALKSGKVSLSTKLDYAKAMTSWIEASQKQLNASTEFAAVEKMDLLLLLENLEDDIPNIPEVPFLIGKLQHLSGNNDEALSNLKRAISLDPSYVSAFQVAAQSAHPIGDLNESIELLNQAVRFDPSDAETWTLLGKLKTGNDDFAAVEAYLKALSFHPNEVSLYVELARLYLNLKNPENAKEILEYAASIDPGNSEVLGLLLIALYDPLLTIENGTNLIEERQQVYIQLHKISPDFAQKRLGDILHEKSGRRLINQR